MSKRLANALFFFLENLGAGIWVGALATFGFAVAAPVFRNLASLTQAGSITAIILHRINLMETVAATLMAVSALVFLLQKSQRTPIRLAKTAVVVLMTMTFLYYGLILMNRLEHLRTEEIRDFDQLSATAQVARDEFDRLHTLYTQLAKANLCMGIGFLLLSAFEKK
ncbi:MAG: DUF4149 domain-containing protein [Deltaproteobacteria bacterium]|nr:DUF4149 domain-containing protein [Deltaproteobacteria bacterium]